MEGTFAITTHVPVDRITDWMLARGYASRADADVDLIMSLLDKTPVTFEHDGLIYEITYVGEVDAYDIAMSAVTS